MIIDFNKATRERRKLYPAPCRSSDSGARCPSTFPPLLTEEIIIFKGEPLQVRPSPFAKVRKQNRNEGKLDLSFPSSPALVSLGSFCRW